MISMSQPSTSLGSESRSSACPPPNSSLNTWENCSCTRTNSPENTFSMVRTREAMSVSRSEAAFVKSSYCCFISPYRAETSSNSLMEPGFTSPSSRSARCSSDTRQAAEPRGISLYRAMAFS